MDEVGGGPGKKRTCMWQGTVCIVTASLERKTGSTTVEPATSRSATECPGREK